MFLKKFSLIIAVIVLLSVSAVTAQDDAATLRDLAPDDFFIGSAVYTYHLDNPVHAEILASEFNMITPEHEAKMCIIQQRRGVFDFRAFDELVAFAEANDMQIHGHALLWHQCTPEWFANGDFTREEAIDILRDHIYTVVGRYKGRVAIWDVVNEAVADSGSGLRVTPWKLMIGDDYVELAFQFAHEADPDALLYYNDYGGEGMNPKSNRIYSIMSDFVERGVPLHGVGLQFHSIVGGLNFDAIAENMQRLGDLGLQVQITELDVRYDGEVTDRILEQQADDYARLMQTCLEQEACNAYITWGVADRHTWLRGSNLGFYNNPTVQPLLYDDDYQPKPAYFAVRDVLEQYASGTLPDADDAAAEDTGTTAVELPEPAFSDAAQLAPDAVPGLAYYAPFPVSITLDGDDADWANVPRVTVDSGTMPDGSTTFEFAAAADATTFYFLADVTDSTVTYGAFDPAAEWYQEDSVEFYINATGDLAASFYSDGIAQIGIPAANIDHADPDAPLFGGGGSADLGVRAVVVPTENGYRVEAAVPLETAVWSITPEQGAVIGFQAHLNGASDSSGRDTKLIWSAADTQDQSWQDPSLFGRLIFWEVE